MGQRLDNELIERLPADKRELLWDVDRLQSELSTVAGSDDWEEAAELERKRSDVLRRVYIGLDRLNAEEGEALALLTRALIDSDRELVEQVSRQRQRLGKELGQLRRGQRAVGAYTRHADR